MWLPSSLRMRLVMLIVIAALLVAGAMGAMAFHMRAAALSDAENRLSMVVKNIVQEHGRIRAAAHQALRTLSRIPEVTGSNPQVCTDALTRIVQGEGLFYNFGVIGLDGNVHCSGHPLSVSVNVSDREYFKRALDTRVFALGNYTMGRVTGQPSMQFVLPVLNENGEPHAVLYAVLLLSKLLAAVSTTDLSEQAVVTLIDPAFNVLARSPPNETIRKSVIGTELHQALIGTKDDLAVASFSRLHSVERMHALARVREGSEVVGYAVVSVPEAVVLGQAHRILISEFLVLVLVIAAMSAVIFIGSNVFVLKRVAALLQATRKIATDDLGARMPSPRDDNEFSVLDNAFNEMADRNESNMRNITRLNRIYVVLSAINSAIVQIRGLKALANEACRIAVEQGGYLSASIFVFDRNSRVARAAGHAGAEKHHFENLEIDPARPLVDGDGPLRKAFKTGEHVVDTVSDQGPDATTSRALRRGHQIGYRAVGAFPLVSKGQIIGALQLCSRNPHEFDGEEVRLLLQLAADTAHGLEQIEQEARLRKLSQAVHQSASAVVVTAPDGTIEYVNPKFEAITGYSAKEVIGQNTRLIKSGVTPVEVYHDMWGKIAAGKEWHGEIQNRRKTGELYWESESISPVTDEKGNIVNFVAIKEDITERISQREKIARLIRIRVVLNEINGAILRIRDPEALAAEACRIAVETGGYLAARVYALDKGATEARPLAHAGAGREHFRNLVGGVNRPVSPEDGPVARSLKSGEFATEQNLERSAKLESKDRYLRFGCRAYAAFPLIAGGGLVGALALYSSTPGAFDEEEVQLLLQLAADTSLGLEHIESEERLYQISNFDRVTGLPNRDLFEDRLTQAIARAPHTHRSICILALRVERLRQIVDAHGWAGVDETLRHVTRYLNDSVRPGDTVARIGDDEFGVLLVDVGSLDDVIAKAENLITPFPKRISWLGAEIITEASMGIATYPTDGKDPKTLIHNAEITLNNLTLRHGNVFAFYAPALDQKAHERMQMEAQLSRAMERGEISLVYQPVVRISNRSIVGAEALLRWNNRLLGQVSPASFVPLAEHTGLIGTFGKWVLETAAAQRLAWAEHADAAFRLAVNVSAVQLRDADFSSQVKHVLEQSKLDPRRLSFGMELTETELIEHIDRVLPLLAALKALGIYLSIDDFGTGYSSLSYLRRLPVDALKIDISFVRDIVTDSNARALANSIVALGHSMDLHIIAEGVETEAQLKVLEAMGCDYAQGYLFSRPVPPIEFGRLLTAPT